MYNTVIKYPPVESGNVDQAPKVDHKKSKVCKLFVSVQNNLLVLFIYTHFILQTFLGDKVRCSVNITRYYDTVYP